MPTLQKATLLLLVGLLPGFRAMETSAQVCITPPSGLVSWWAAEGVASDETGVNHGALQNGITFAGGAVGLGFSFDGVDDYVSVAASSSLDIGAGSGFTIEGWINPASITAQQVIAEWNDGIGGVGVHFMHSIGALGGEGSLFANIADTSGGSHYFATAANVLVAGMMQHVAMTYDKNSGDAKIFLNGSEVGSANVGMVTPQTTYPLYLGTRFSGLGVGSFFNGVMDELSLYNRALSENEILAIFGASSAGKCRTPTVPFVFSQPTSQTVPAGTNVSLIVLAGGTPPLSYQWQFNNVPLADATNSSLTFTNVSKNQAGTYAVEVTNPYGSIMSSNATLTVLVFPPALTTQPTNQTVALGDTALLAVHATGSPPLAYQWNFRSSPLVGATNALLMLTNVTTNQAGPYSVTVTNSYGMATSSNATLAIVVLTTNLFDDFEPNIDTAEWSGFGGTVLATNYGGAVSGSNSLWFGGTGSRYAMTRAVNTTNGGYVRFHLRLASGGASTWETVDLPGEGVVFEVSTNGGSLWSELGRYDTSTYFNWTSLSVPITAAAQDPFARFRWRQLSNSGASLDHWALDDVAILTVAIPPEIVTQPQSQTVSAGAVATFGAGVSGSSPFNYQWRRNSTDVPGATNAAFTLTNVQPSQAGLFSVRIANGAGVATSSNAVLKVIVVSATGNGQALTNATHSFGGAVIIQLQNAYAGGLIFYTLDGSQPTFTSSQYVGPFVISNSSTLRALGYSTDFLESGELDPVNILLPPAYHVAITSSGGGSVSANPPNGPYLSNSVVTLTATPFAGWMFLKWMGDASGTSPTTNLTITRSKSVKAIFGTTINTTAAGGGSVILNPAGGIYPYGTTVQLSAVPNPGNQFALWGNAASGNVNPLLFVLTNANPTVSSLFAAVSGGQSALTVVPVGRGQVTVNPRANAYATGAGVSINAIPDLGQSFLGWSGDGDGLQNPLATTVNSNRTIFANFTVRPQLTISTSLHAFRTEGPQLTILGSSGEAYRLESSTNLSQWSPVANLTNSYGSVQFTDPAATNSPRILYRAKWLQ